MVNQRDTVKLEIRSKALAGRIHDLLASDVTFGVWNPRSGESPRLILHELVQADEAGFQALEKSLKSVEASVEFFIIGEATESGLLMRLMRLGVKEFLPTPLNEEEFRAALKRFKKRSGGSRGAGQIISVLGSKGGVGTTTVAVNMAVALAQHKPPYSVCLFDLNTLFGDIPLFLDLTPRYHWGEITKNMERLDDHFLMNILTRHASGVHLLPSPAYLNGHIPPSPSIIDSLLGLMQTLFDYVIVDTGHAMDDPGLRALQVSDIVFLVSQLSMPCLSHTGRLLKSLYDLGYVSPEQVRVIINRHMRKNEISLKDAETGLKCPIFCTIKNDFTTSMAAINQGAPITQYAPKSPIAKSINELIGRLMPEVAGAANKRWRFFNR